MRRLTKIFPVILIALGSAGDLCATGYYGPDLYLDQGGKNVDASPEFYWELEVKRLSREFHPAEKLVVFERERSEENEDARSVRSQENAEADLKDFAAALQEGRIKPPDPTRATQLHAAARDFIQKIDITTTAPLPEEFASEFSDYHRGASAYRRGPEHWNEARQVWEDLLKRPEQERHYRTVWTTFMLGKVALKLGDSEAAKWFQRTRELAKAGFADSLGMAASSYGWEGRSEWKQKHPGTAAGLFLTQLALGDESAIVSLKALVPDRVPIEGMLNYGPESEEIGKWSVEQKREAEQKIASELRAAAENPLLRRLVTVHILATESSPDFYGEDSSNAPANRCARWLGIVQSLRLDQIEDAEYLGWTAYNSGDYRGAAHWLELSKNDSAAAAWLRAKLQRRAGKLGDAAKSMAQAWQLIHGATAYTGWKAPVKDSGDEFLPSAEGLHWTFEQCASGDLGGLHLARGDFVQSLDTLQKGGLWNDAAFVAERVLTANELKAYVDQLSDAGAHAGGENSTDKLRYLLGRRLVREDRYAEAARYLRPPYDKVLERYAKALREGADVNLSKIERARALFTAAWLARYDGMELMGTEVAPDVFVERGSFEITDLAKQRRSGVYQKVRYEKNGEQTTTNAPVLLKPSKQELQRLATNKINPDTRFHYRLIAGALAIKAANLLPNDSEELADVVNRAGLWVKDRDEKIGDRYFKIIEQRCARTEIGRAAVAKHWFVDESGTWSKAQEEAHQALQKELNIQTDN